MIAAKSAIEKACKLFMEQDDTDPELIAHLQEIKRLKTKVSDRMANVGKELNAIRNIFRGFQNR